MISHLSLIVFGLVGLTMTAVVHSIPVKSMQESKSVSIEYIRFLFLSRPIYVPISESIVSRKDGKSVVSRANVSGEEETKYR